MAEDLAKLEELIANLTEQLAPAQRRKLARRVGTELRKRNAQRIRDQIDPDGKPFEPRKLRQLQGKGVRKAASRRRKMFLRAAGTKHLKVKVGADQVEIGFLGSAGRIMAVHHYGLRGRVSPEAGAPEASYPERRVLGLPQNDVDAVLKLILDQLDKQ